MEKSRNGSFDGLLQLINNIARQEYGGDMCLTKLNVFDRFRWLAAAVNEQHR